MGLEKRLARNGGCMGGNATVEPELFQGVKYSGTRGDRGSRVCSNDFSH